MKKNSTLILFLIVCFIVRNETTEAQIKKELTSRFSQTVKGNVTIIANNVLSRHKTNNYSGGDGNHDFTDNVFVDIDNDATTFNSSSANLSNPEPAISCLNIKKAYLYWAAADKEEDNTANEPNWDYNKVKLKLPGSTNYTTITADEVIYRGRDEHFVNDPYVCFKDITSSVKALTTPYGKYQIANVRAKKGGLASHDAGNTGTSGGWQVVFVYESPTLPAKNISLFDGYAHVTKNVNSFEIMFSGFQTVPQGSVNADIVIGALEGDRDLEGDKLQIKKGDSTWGDISYSLRSANNFFNSKITKNGSNFLDRNPASTNTLGFDADVFPLDNPNNTIIDNDQTSAVIRLTSDQETYGLFLIGLSVDVWKPDLAPLQLLSSSSNVNSGDNLTFSTVIKNNGNDNIKDLKIKTTIPNEVDLIEPIVGLPSWVSYNYNATTKLLTFTVEDGETDVDDSAYTLSYKVKVKEQCYFLKEQCSDKFQMQLEATYKGIENPDTQTTLSSQSLDLCGTGDGLPSVIDLNPPNEDSWITTSIDRTVSCDDEDALVAAQMLAPKSNCDLAVTKTKGSFVASTDCPIVGTYTNTWIFTDACGRTSDVFKQVITVIDDKAPTINCPTVASNYNVDAGKCTYTGSFEATTTDNCSSTTIEYTVDGSVISFPYDFPVGTTNISAKAKDKCGNVSAVCTFKVTVTDNIPPSITCSEEIMVNVDVGECSATVSLTEPTTSDNCTVASVSNDAPSTFPVGETVVTWTVTDSSGLTATCEQKVTVTDNIPPSVVCPTVSESYTVDAGECSYSGSFEATATDNCSVSGYSYYIGDSEISFPYDFPVGKTTVSAIATDSNGNDSEPCTFEIEVTDNIPPSITCSEDVMVNVGVGECSATVSLTEPTTSDNCTVASVSNDAPSTFPVGETVVTWTVTDSSGLTATCEQKVTVTDNIPPSVVCPTVSESYTVDAGECSYSGSFEATATDNCSVSGYSYYIGDSEISFPYDFPVGKTIVSAIATDSNGNDSEPCTFEIEVTDNIPPLFDLSGKYDLELECGDENMDTSEALQEWLDTNAGVTVTDNCGVVNWTNNYGEDTSVKCEGEGITITFTATDESNNSVSFTANYLIKDTQAPTITMQPLSKTVKCDGEGNTEDLNSWLTNNGGAMATDDCSVITWSNDFETFNYSCGKTGEVEVVFLAKDACGNVTETIKAKFIIEDTEAPVFAEELPSDATVSCDAIPTAVTLTATDNCSATTDLIVNYSEEVSGQDGDCASTYTITRVWSVSDCAGNEAKHTQVITVEDSEAPVFAEELPSDATVSCDAIPTAVTLTATDNCSATTDLVVNYSEEVSGQDDDCASTYTITRVWSVSDCAGNATSHTQVVTVEDTEAPTLVSELENVSVECDNVPKVPTLEFTDNCSENVTQIDFEEENTFDGTDNDYSITRTWTVTDDCGNVAEFVQNINVVVKKEVIEVVDSRCIEDIEVNLFDYLPENMSKEGVWEPITRGVVLPSDGVFRFSNISVGEYQFSYSVANNGCYASTKVTINLHDECVVLPCGEEDVAISKAVTPNGDSWNEFFEVTGVEECGFVVNVQIFNRWGARVFKSNNYANDWNGVSQGTKFGNAKQLPAGSYYYIVVLEDSGLKPFSGTLYLGTK